MEVDLCFVIDCTGSMAFHIKAAKDCIIKVVDHMANMKPEIKIWVSFCGYRDHCDGNNRIQILDFTDSCEQFRSYVSNVQATGGGDVPEDVLGGLNTAVGQMRWRHATRVLFHIGDAPPHGRRFTKAFPFYKILQFCLCDSYPNGDPNNLTAESVLEKMISAEIHYFFGKINGSTDEMIRVFRGIIGEFLVFNLKNVKGDPESLVNKFFEATCTAVTTAVSHHQL